MCGGFNSIEILLMDILVTLLILNSVTKTERMVIRTITILPGPNQCQNDKDRIGVYPFLDLVATVFVRRRAPFSFLDDDKYDSRESIALHNKPVNNNPGKASFGNVCIKTIMILLQ